MKKLMQWMMISCRKAGILIEKKINKQISPVEKIELVIHTQVCKACRTYEKQSKDLDDAMEKSFDPPQESAPEDLKETLKKKFE